MTRPSKVDHYLDIARTVAKRSPCSRRKFGSIIVKNDIIIATGYNGTIRGALNCGKDIPCIKDIANEPAYVSYESCPAFHSEENCCLMAGRDRAVGGTLYLAPYEGQGDRPCYRCRRAIVQVGLKDVYFINRDGEVEHDMVNSYVDMEDDRMEAMLDRLDPEWRQRLI